MGFLVLGTGINRADQIIAYKHFSALSFKAFVNKITILVNCDLMLPIIYYHKSIFFFR